VKTESPASTLLSVLGSAIRRLAEGGSGEELLPGLLKELTVRCGAERAFLVELEGAGPAVSCSATIDGDSVPDAANRIPVALFEAARNAPPGVFRPGGENLPPRVAEEFRALDRKGLLLYRLVDSRGKPIFVFLENRFCPIEEEAAFHAETLLVLDVMRLCRWASGVTGELETIRRELAKAEALVAETRAPRMSAPALEPSTRSRNRDVSSPPSFKGDYGAIITCSPRMYSIFSVIDKVAHTSAPVLITGESGTGKELIARAIHDNSPRAGKPFVPENCAALTETLLESELFGYVKGAFTGAAGSKKGLFELADGGTLFLDEVGEMSLGMQKKLLRALQEGVVRPVGGKNYIRVDVRIISATNMDLVQAFKEERFREDLYYRLNVIAIELPPLRDRVEDIPLLVEHFLKELAEENSPPKKIRPEAMALLQSYHWPGNVRQLQNEVQRLHALSGEVIEVEDLSPKIRTQAEKRRGFSLSELELLPLKEAISIFERELLRKALERFGGNKTKVAERLGIPKTSLYNKLQKHKLLGR